MPRGYSFRPRLWALALGAAACAAFIALGNWQAGRADEKRAAGARLDAALGARPLELSGAAASAADYVGRRVAARGELIARHTVLIDHKIRHGRVGYEVVTPLRLAGGERHVLVNRGWIEAGPRRDALPAIRTPEGEVRLEALALERFPLAYTPADAPPPSGRVWQNVRLEDFAAASGLALQPFVLAQLSETGDGLERDWPRPDFGVDRHASYALQWYSLAALAVVLAVVLSLRRDAPAAG